MFSLTSANPEGRFTPNQDVIHEKYHIVIKIFENFI